MPIMTAESADYSPRSTAASRIREEAYSRHLMLHPWLSGYTIAAWRNRVPAAAWALMIFIAIFSSLHQGYSVRGEAAKIALLLVLPLTASLSLSLIADVDSPRWGVIRVSPQNMLDLQRSIAQ